MLRALKNDIVALEFPINHFIGHCIRNGEWPLWFNTWGMGFPLHSNLTWGVYSTPQLAFSSIFNYNIYALHIEFMFFVLLAGWGMFYLLHQYLVKEERLARLLAIAYMLSGFVVGSTQWLLYITASAFIPLVIAALMKLLEKPNWKNSLQLAVLYTLMFTSVYAAFNIISTYSIAGFLVIYFLGSRKDKKMTGLRLRFLLLSACIIVLLCLPCLYFTIELLGYMDRGGSITGNTAFFESNYLHPGALTTLLLPLGSVKMAYANTEGTMLNTYMGLLMLLLIPGTIISAIKERSKPALLLGLAALLFLVISFGALLPVRQALNILPGFPYFRNPAIFRYYFILALILCIAWQSRDKSFSSLLQDKFFRYTGWLLAACCVSVMMFNLSSLRGLPADSVSGLVKNISLPQTQFIAAFVQLVMIVLILLFAGYNKRKMAGLVFAAELVINTLLCTPFYSVSSYSLPEVNNILRAEKGFPLQVKSPDEVDAVYTDEKGNHWQNINVFSSEVSARESYRGPLVLKQTGSQDSLQAAPGKPLVYADQDGATITLLLQRPSHVRAKVILQTPGTVILRQHYYPGWSVYNGNKKLKLIQGERSGLAVNLPSGVSVIDFRYERNDILVSALFLNLFVIIYFLLRFFDMARKIFTRSSSPS